MMRRLPQAVLMTLVVIGTPLLIVTFLVSFFGAPGSVSSVVGLVATATSLSLIVSYGGAALWSHRTGAGDVLFTDLTLWGWVGSWRRERQLASATRLLELQAEPSGETPFRLTSDERVRLLERLTSILEARHPDTHGHSRRVARHATAIAQQMDLSDEEVARIRTAAAVHDVGKIYVPTDILDKPSKLTATEFDRIKDHSIFGAEMVAALGDPELTRIVRHHHERLDGTGYPDGLAGDDIPLGARIIAVADTFDAVTSERPYRDAKPHKEALELLSAEAGTQLDPDAVRAFRRYYSGHRRVALLALLLNGPRELAIALTGGLKLGGVVLATTLAAVGAGGVAIDAENSGQSPQSASAATPVATAPVASTATGGQAAGSDKGKDNAKAPGTSVDAVTAVPDQEAPSTVGSGGGEAAPTESPSGSGGGTTGSNSGSGDSGSSNGSGSGGGGETVANPVPSTPAVTVPETSKVTDPVTSTVNSVVETTKTISITVTTPEVAPVLPKLTVGIGGGGK